MFARFKNLRKPKQAEPVKKRFEDGDIAKEGAHRFKFKMWLAEMHPKSIWDIVSNESIDEIQKKYQCETHPGYLEPYESTRDNLIGIVALMSRFLRTGTSIDNVAGFVTGYFKFTNCMIAVYIGDFDARLFISLGGSYYIIHGTNDFEPVACSYNDIYSVIIGYDGVKDVTIMGYTYNDKESNDLYERDGFRIPGYYTEQRRRINDSNMGAQEKNFKLEAIKIFDFWSMYGYKSDRLFYSIIDKDGKRWKRKKDGNGNINLVPTQDDNP